MIRMQRLVSYFGEKDGLNGLIKHIGDDQISCELLSVLWDERAEDYIPYEPFEQWPAAGDESFKDLVKSLMNLDPAKRLTAPAALEHAWFADDS